MLLVRVVAAGSLALSGLVHLDLAGSYDRIGEQISVGVLFRVQGVAALLAAAWLVARRAAAPVALAVGAVSLVAVVLSVYVRLPAVGPLPELYEPVWYPQKAVSAVAAGVAALGALLLLRRDRSGPVP